ncbi:transketolase [Poriferisphaera sp. WC338]|uniref:transketolase n=1 Tax=Poriferisphaera sp. WC338 TaxID=3425129 RepID=UPI003D8131AB
MSFDSTVQAKAIELIKCSYEITGAAGSGHPSSCASLGHLISVLMYQHMRWEPSNPSHPASDRLMLSEGHAVPIVYAACADKGVMIGEDKERWKPMTKADALTLRQIDSRIDGHPNPKLGFPFFDAATGSLGQGLSVAAGIALAAKADGLDKRVFVLIGDGESREGQVWEAADFLRDHDLKAVCPIFNCNQFAQSEEVSKQQSAEVLVKKLEAAGFEVLVIDGHSPSEIRDALNRHAEVHEASDAAANGVAIVAKTEKGWGAASMKGNGHHGQAPKGEALEKVLAELEETGKATGAYALGGLKIPAMSPRKSNQKIDDAPMNFSVALKAFGKESALEQGKMATRNAYGVGLRALGHAKSDLFALDCDVRGSTGSAMFAGDEKVNDRFVECRIAEQNMMSVAAGLSAGGKIPFASTFGKFAVRGYDQIEMAIMSGANMKLVGSHSGATLGADGPSQMGLSDVGWFRGFTGLRNYDVEGKLKAGSGAGMYVLTPSDAYQCYALMREMMAWDGPCYLRTLRPETEFLYGDEDKFTLGGHELLIEGKDLLIAANGYMVHQANKAIEELDDLGIDVGVVDLYSLPFESEALLDYANDCGGNILTIEDNYCGGLGSAVTDLVCQDGGGFTVNQMYVKRMPKSGLSADNVLNYVGLGVDDIVREAKEVMGIED